MRAGRVCVIGAGVVGASSAYFLRKRGWDVTLIDRTGVGAGSSFGNCGYICPSHVFPLAKPGAMASVLPLMLRRNSPFCVRPRLDLHLWSWMARFASCSRRPDLVHETADALHALLVASKRDYLEMIRAESIKCGLEELGCLFISMHEEHLDEFSETNREIQERFGLGAERLDGAELARREPSLRDGLGGAWYFACDAHIRPDAFMKGLGEVLVRQGVEVRSGVEAVSAKVEGGRVRRIQTNVGDIEADAFVVATGAWTPKIAQITGVRLAIEPGKGYSLTFERPRNCPRLPMIFEEDRVAVTAFEDGLRLGSLMEFAGYDESLRPERLGLLTAGASKYFREWEAPVGGQAWYGWRPMTPDGRPFVDFAPGRSNMVVAAGHNMIGMSTGPGTGRLVAEMLSGEETNIDVGKFRVDRDLM